MLRTNECCGFEKGKGKHDSQEDKINQLTYSQDIITLLLSCVHKLVPRREVKAVVEMNPKTNVTLKTAASCPSGGLVLCGNLFSQTCPLVFNLHHLLLR